MKGRLRLLLLATIPLFVFVNVFQTYRYQTVQRSIETLLSQQKNWLEENERIIAGLAVLGAPARIERIAKDKLGLTQDNLRPSLQILPYQAKPSGGEG